METEPHNMTCIDTKGVNNLKFVDEEKDLWIIFKSKVEVFKSYYQPKNKANKLMGLI